MAHDARAPRCQRRPTDEDFARFPIGTVVAVPWGSEWVRPGRVVGRTAFRLRVFLTDKPAGRVKLARNADNTTTEYHAQPSPLTVRKL